MSYLADCNPPVGGGAFITIIYVTRTTSVTQNSNMVALSVGTMGEIALKVVSFRKAEFVWNMTICNIQENVIKNFMF